MSVRSEQATALIGALDAIRDKVASLATESNQCGFPRAQSALDDALDDLEDARHNLVDLR